MELYSINLRVKGVKWHKNGGNRNKNSAGKSKGHKRVSLVNYQGINMTNVIVVFQKKTFCRNFYQFFSGTIIFR